MKAATIVPLCLALWAAWARCTTAAPSLPTPNVTVHHIEIAYGQVAQPGQFPFVVYLELAYNACTGSLITPTVVLTAQHCIYDDNGKEVPLDSIHAYIGDVDYTQATKYGVKSRILGPYNPTTGYGDIMLLELDQPVPPLTPPVALVPSTFDVASLSSATALGWGLLQDQSSSPLLHYASLSHIPPQPCKQVANLLEVAPPPEDHTCFGLDQATPTNTCAGDSGGPYVVDDQNNPNTTVQVAVTSYGDTKCGAVNQNLDISLSVAYWREWIDKGVAGLGGGAVTSGGSESASTTTTTPTTTPPTTPTPTTKPEQFNITNVAIALGGSGDDTKTTSGSGCGGGWNRNVILSSVCIYIVALVVVL